MQTVKSMVERLAPPAAATGLAKWERAIALALATDRDVTVHANGVRINTVPRGAVSRAGRQAGLRAASNKEEA